MIHAEYNNRKDRLVITGFMPNPILTNKLSEDTMAEVAMSINSLHYYKVALMEQLRKAGVTWKEV